MFVTVLGCSRSLYWKMFRFKCFFGNDIPGMANQNNKDC